MDTIDSGAQNPRAGSTTADDALFRKIAWRLMPLLFACYLVAQIDRMNISFAKIQMLESLHFSETIYGLGAGIFFIGYCFFEVPANILLKRFGARRWIAAIMISWGVVSAATLLVSTPASFYLMRFLLGVAEAGFFPGVVYYMTFWFTQRQRGRMTAGLMTAIAFSGLIVGPVSGAILHGMDGLSGLNAWQWIFLAEGVPAVVLGVVCLVYLDSSPDAATWLTFSEKAALARILDAAHVGPAAVSARAVFSAAPVWLCSGIYACYGTAFFGVVFWLPTIIKGAGVDDPLIIGLLTAIPWGTAIIAMIAIAAYVDRRQNSRRVLTVLAVVSGAGLGLSTLTATNVSVAVVTLTVALAGMMTALPVFWNLPTRLFKGTGAAVGIAAITSFGNLPGFLAPYAVGWIKDRFGSMDIAMYIFVGFMLLSVPLLVKLPPEAGK